MKVDSIRTWTKYGISDNAALLLSLVAMEDGFLNSDLKHGDQPRDRAWMNKHHPESHWRELRDAGLIALSKDDGQYHCTQIGIDLNKQLVKESLEFCDREFARLRKLKEASTEKVSDPYQPPEPEVAPVFRRDLFGRVNRMKDTPSPSR